MSCSRPSIARPTWCGFEDEFATDPEWIYRYRFAGGYHPFHPFSMLYMGGLARELAAAVYVAGAKSPGHARGDGRVAGTRPSRRRCAEAARHVGRDPRVLVVPDLSTPAFHLTAAHRA